MKIEIETLRAEFSGNNARISQDFSGEEAKLGKVLLWVAGGGFATLSLLGNFAFAGFWALFMLGCWWFLQRVSGQFHEVHIDKSSGKVHVLSRTG
jgi:hypothetical protein